MIYFILNSKLNTQILGIATAVFLSGCDSTFRGEPQQNRGADDNKFTELVLNIALDKTTITNALGEKDDNKRRSQQTSVIFARIAEIDLLYNQYETDLLTESQKSGFGFSLVGIVTSAAGTLATGRGAQNLALASTLAQNTRASFSAEVLGKRTINALVSQMRANRAEIRAGIFEKLNGSGNYSLVAAVSDLELYRQAGTLASALVGIGETAAAAQKIQESAAAQKQGEFFGIASNTRIESAQLTSRDLDKNFTQQKTLLSQRIKDGGVDIAKIDALFGANISDATLMNELASFKTLLDASVRGSTQSETDFSAGIERAKRKKISLIIDTANFERFSLISPILER